MKYPKSILWFIALACIAIAMGLIHGPEYGFLFFGVSTIVSLVFYAIYAGV